MSNFIISDGSTTQQIDDGETFTFTSGGGITATVSATNTVTLGASSTLITGQTAETSVNRPYRKCRFWKYVKLYINRR